MEYKHNFEDKSSEVTNFQFLFQNMCLCSLIFHFEKQLSIPGILYKNICTKYLVKRI